MWKQWKKRLWFWWHARCFLNMTGCKKQEEKLKEPQTEQKPGKRMKKRQRAKRKRFRRIKICWPVLQTCPDSNWKTSGCSYGEQSWSGTSAIWNCTGGHSIWDSGGRRYYKIDGSLCRLYESSTICPIRSCRYYFPALSQRGMMLFM